MINIYIGLGSNLNNPLKQIENAVDELSMLPNTKRKVVSSIYATAPVGFLDQPNFLNAVCHLETSLSPEKLLTKMLEIEQKHLRIRNEEKNGPRTLDLDILLYGNQHMKTKKIEIPHPRFTERAFVMVPLLEIAPNLVLPDGRVVREIAESDEIRKQEIVLFSTPE